MAGQLIPVGGLAGRQDATLYGGRDARRYSGLGGDSGGRDHDFGLSKTAGGQLIEDYGAMRMQLQGGRGNAIGPGSLQGLGDDRRLLCAGGEEEASAGGQDGAHAHSERVSGRLGRRKKMGCVLGAGRRGEELDVGPGIQGRQRFVEAEMAVLTDAEQLQVDSAVLGDQRFIADTFFRQIGGHAIGQVSSGGLNIDLPEQMVVHVIAVRIGMVCGQANVFIQIKGPASGKIQSGVVMQ